MERDDFNQGALGCLDPTLLGLYSSSKRLEVEGVSAPPSSRDASLPAVTGRRGQGHFGGLRLLVICESWGSGESHV